MGRRDGVDRDIPDLHTLSRVYGQKLLFRNAISENRLPKEAGAVKAVWDKLVGMMPASVIDWVVYAAIAAVTLLLYWEHRQEEQEEKSEVKEK